MRFERYDDDFIDDSELELAKGGGPARTRYSGFYVMEVRAVVVCVCVYGWGGGVACLSLCVKLCAQENSAISE